MKSFQMASGAASLQLQIQHRNIVRDMQAKLSRTMYRLEQLEKMAWREKPPGVLKSPALLNLSARLSLVEVQMSDFLCCVCLNAKRDIVFNPCHHHVTCGGCCIRLLKQEDSKCPICRSEIESYMKIHG